MVMFEQLKRQETVPEQVARILRHAILRGELATGERLPSEKSLAEQFSTNRVSLRQALQILKGDGLIEGGQGKAWQVTDFRLNGSIALLPDIFEVQGLSEEAIELVHDFIRLRTPFLREAVGLAAERATDQQLTNMKDALQVVQQKVKEGASTEQLFLAEIHWFDLLFASSNSFLFQSIYRSISEVYKRFKKYVSVMWTPPEGYPTELVKLQNTIEAKKPEEAKEILVAYMESEAERLRSILEQVAAITHQKGENL